MARALKLPLSTLGLTLLADLASKAAVQQRFQAGESLQIMPGLAFCYVMNPGAAFSMLATMDAGLRVPLFLGVALVALGVMAYFFRGLPEKDRLSIFALGLVAGGAIGNLLDRVRYGEVVDFILVDLGFWPFHPWPIFNVADSAVCVGVALLAWRSFKPLR